MHEKNIYPLKTINRIKISNIHNEWKAEDAKLPMISLLPFSDMCKYLYHFGNGLSLGN